MTTTKAEIGESKKCYTCRHVLGTVSFYPGVLRISLDHQKDVWAYVCTNQGCAMYEVLKLDLEGK